MRSPSPQASITLAAEIVNHSVPSPPHDPLSASIRSTSSGDSITSIPGIQSPSMATSGIVYNAGEKQSSELERALQDVFRTETAALALSLKSSLATSLTASLTASLSGHLRHEVSEEMRRWQRTSVSSAAPSQHHAVASQQQASTGLLPPPTSTARRISMAMFDEAGDVGIGKSRKSMRPTRNLKFADTIGEEPIMEEESSPSVCLNGKRVSCFNVSIGGLGVHHSTPLTSLAEMRSGGPALASDANPRQRGLHAGDESQSLELAPRRSVKSEVPEEAPAASPSLLKRPNSSSQKNRRRSFRFLASSELIDEEVPKDVTSRKTLHLTMPSDEPVLSTGRSASRLPGQLDNGMGISSQETLDSMNSVPLGSCSIVPSHFSHEEGGGSTQLACITPEISWGPSGSDRSQEAGSSKKAADDALITWASTSSEGSSMCDSQLTRKSNKSRQSKHSTRQSTTNSVGCWRPCHDRLRRLVDWTVFDYCVSTLVILNAASIGIQTNYMVAHLAEETPYVFRVIDTSFCVLWTTELVLRLSVYGNSFFTMAGCRWNIFDAAVVGLQLLEELVSAAANTRDTAMPTNLNVVRLLRVLRLVRIIRLVRLLRFIQELRTMVCSIANSFRSLCWTIVLLMLMVYVVSVCLTQLIADHGQGNPDIFSEDKLLQEHYSSLFRSVLSLFQAITGGVDWNELLAPLMLHIHPMIAVVFSFYICFAVLAMMNVITGVFVESALTAAKADREGDLLAQLHTLFLKIDVDRSGVISWDEFACQLDNPHMETYFKALDIDSSEAYGLFALLDVNNCGEVSVEEFVLGCLRLRGTAQAIDLATLTYFNKRMSTRWRVHAQRVEAMLSDILDLSHGAQTCKEGDTEAQASTSMTHLSYPTLLDSTNAGDGTGDLATWAELKAKGEAAREQRGRGSLSNSDKEKIPAKAQAKKVQRACTYSFGVEDRQGSKRGGVKSPASDSSFTCDGSKTLPADIGRNLGDEATRSASISSMPMGKKGPPSSGCSSVMSGSINPSDVHEEDLTLPASSVELKDGLFATWAELKADGERRRGEHKSS